VKIKRPGAEFFNAGCKEQVFSPKPRKKLTQIHLVIFRKMQKPHTLNPKNDITEPKARLF